MNKRTARDRADALRFLHRAAAAGAGLVESAFVRHMNLEGLDRAGLAAYLGCDAEGVERMALCTLPAAPTFEEDTDSISALGPVDPERLRPILRRYQLTSEAKMAAESPGDYSAEDL